MQVMHALKGDTLHGLFGEDGESVCNKLVRGDVLEGPKEVILARHKRIDVSTILVTYINTGLGITMLHHI